MVENRFYARAESVLITPEIEARDSRMYGDKKLEVGKDLVNQVVGYVVERDLPWRDAVAKAAELNL